MASNILFNALVVNNGMAGAQDPTFFATYGYTNCVVFRSTNGVSADDVHHIISGSNHFVGDSLYDRAPIGSVGYNKAASTSATVIYAKFTSSGQQASAWAAR